MQSAPALDWESIDTVLLDMDGTLLDLGFDNWFWLTLIPSRFAAANDITEEEARSHLAPRFRNVAGTLPWYCIEHWTRELDLDIGAIKRQEQARVGFLPGAEGFLKRLKRSGKRVVLVTNSHPTTLAIKDEQVALTRYFDACYSSHAFAAPKEHAEFWPRLIEREPFVPTRTLFVDDSVPVLNAARAFGIAQLRAVRRPDSGKPAQSTADYIAVDAVAELL